MKKRILPYREIHYLHNSKTTQKLEKWTCWIDYFSVCSVSVNLIFLDEKMKADRVCRDTPAPDGESVLMKEQIGFK